MPECIARRRELERRARAMQTEARRHVTPGAGESTAGRNCSGAPAVGAL